MQNTIILKRINYTSIYTLGFIKHKDFFCFTLEPSKTSGKGCISCGTYPIVLEYSPKFKRYLWELKDVPNFTEIKVHELNKVTQTDGCIGVGFSFNTAADPIPGVVLGNSHRAVTTFNDLCHAEKITHIEIRYV